MSSLYILYSPSLDKYYTGITTDPVKQRLEKHNSGFYGKRFTSAASDWVIQLEIETIDYAHARRMELYVKSRKSRVYILSLIQSKTEQDQLFNRTISIG